MTVIPMIFPVFFTSLMTLDFITSASAFFYNNSNLVARNDFELMPKLGEMNTRKAGPAGTSSLENAKLF